MTKPLPIDQRIANKAIKHPGRIVYVTRDEQTHVTLYLKQHRTMIRMAAYSQATKEVVTLDL